MPALVTFAVALLEFPDVQPSKVLTKGIANQRRPIQFCATRSPVCGAQQFRVEDNLDGFHMWTLLHSILHSQRCYVIGLGPLFLGANDGFSVRELNQIRAEVARNMERILQAWHEHCG